MHPTIMMALANEVANERQNEQRKLQLRSQALAAPDHESRAAHAGGALARRLVATISLRPRLS